MTKFLFVFLSAFLGYSSFSLACIPSIAKDVTYRIVFPGDKVLTAEPSGGAGHVTVYIELTVKKASSETVVVKFNEDNLQLVDTVKRGDATDYTFLVIGTGRSEISVVRNGVVSERQEINTKVLPSPRGC
ncbi:MAG: hypothetical protein A4S09_07915 [Proteobacteria bacterium SG_bin7]|nr:MAG: hypothetical protein A4S09_07915 [Proteobacteria bacterium SG_bin7]